MRHGSSKVFLGGGSLDFCGTLLFFFVFWGVSLCFFLVCVFLVVHLVCFFWGGGVQRPWEGFGGSFEKGFSAPLLGEGAVLRFCGGWVVFMVMGHGFLGSACSLHSFWCLFLGFSPVV